MFPAESLGIWVCDSGGVPNPGWTAAPPAESAFQGQCVAGAQTWGEEALSQREMEVVGGEVVGSAEGLIMESRLPQAPRMQGK